MSTSAAPQDLMEPIARHAPERSAMALCVLLVAASVLPSPIYSFFFFALVLVLLLQSGMQIPRQTMRALIPLASMIVLGLILAYRNDAATALKDVWYGAKAMTCLLLGSLLGRRIRDQRGFVDLFIRTMFALELYHLAAIAVDPSKIGIEGTGDATDYPMVSAFAVAFLLLPNWRNHFSGSQLLRALAVICICASFALSFSRTSIGTLAFVVVAAIGLFENIRRLIALVAAVVILMAASASVPPSIEGGNITFLAKLQNSLSEISFTDETDRAEMLINWRGFEAYRALLAFEESSLVEKVIGRGLGATVDLGMEIQMSDEMSYQYLPILHNGYFHILAKYGIAGVLLYAIFLGRITVSARRYQLRTGQRLGARLTLAAGLILIYTSLVITGVLNKGRLDPLLLLTGWLLCGQHQALVLTGRRGRDKPTDHGPANGGAADPTTPPPRQT